MNNNSMSNQNNNSMSSNNMMPPNPNMPVNPGVPSSNIMPPNPSMSVNPGIQSNNMMPPNSNMPVNPGVPSSNIMPPNPNMPVNPGMQSNNMMPPNPNMPVNPGMQSNNIMPPNPGIQSNNMMPEKNNIDENNVIPTNPNIGINQVDPINNSMLLNKDASLNSDVLMNNISTSDSSQNFSVPIIESAPINPGISVNPGISNNNMNNVGMEMPNNETNGNIPPKKMNKKIIFLIIIIIIVIVIICYFLFGSSEAGLLNKNNIGSVEGRVYKVNSVGETTGCDLVTSTGKEITEFKEYDQCYILNTMYDTIVSVKNKVGDGYESALMNINGETIIEFGKHDFYKFAGNLIIGVDEIDDEDDYITEEFLYNSNGKLIKKLNKDDFFPAYASENLITVYEDSSTDKYIYYDYEGDVLFETSNDVHISISEDFKFFCIPKDGKYKIYNEKGEFVFDLVDSTAAINITYFNEDNYMLNQSFYNYIVENGKHIMTIKSFSPIDYIDGNYYVGYQKVADNGEIIEPDDYNEETDYLEYLDYNQYIIYNKSTDVVNIYVDDKIVKTVKNIYSVEVLNNSNQKYYILQASSDICTYYSTIESKFCNLQTMLNRYVFVNADGTIASNQMYNYYREYLGGQTNLLDVAQRTSNSDSNYYLVDKDFATRYTMASEKDSYNYKKKVYATTVNNEVINQLQLGDGTVKELVDFEYFNADKSIIYYMENNKYIYFSLITSKVLLESDNELKYILYEGDVYYIHNEGNSSKIYASDLTTVLREFDYVIEKYTVVNAGAIWREYIVGYCLTDNVNNYYYNDSFELIAVR